MTYAHFWAWPYIKHKDIRIDKRPVRHAGLSSARPADVVYTQLHTGSHVQSAAAVLSIAPIAPPAGPFRITEEICGRCEY